MWPSVARSWILKFKWSCVASGCSPGWQRKGWRAPEVITAQKWLSLYSNPGPSGSKTHHLSLLSGGECSKRVVNIGLEVQNN